MLEWPKPTTTKALRGFLGLMRYYKKFVPNYGKIIVPLTDKLKKDSFHWTLTTELAFDEPCQVMAYITLLA